jgi:AcrR family transcriptional regulator
MANRVPPEEERQQILDAAIACFTELGYERTSLDAIAARARLPASTVSRHFADMTDVRAAVIALWSERLSAWVTSA